MIRGILAQATVSDLDRAEQWYRPLFGRDPDHRPMPGLLEWRIDERFGLQLWADADRAGRGTVVLEDTALDETAAALTDAGIGHDGIAPVDVGRVLALTDPDGNKVVLAG